MELNNPKVSIIMNCFNGAKYLRQSIKVLFLNLTKIGSLFFGIICQLMIQEKYLKALMMIE